MSQWLLGWIRQHWRRLVALHDTPHSIAGGVAIGIVLGFTPFFTVKTLLAVALAWLFRCSKAAAVVAVALHDVTLPLTPVLLRLEYGLGFWCLSHPHRWPPALHLHSLPVHWHEWFRAGVFGQFLWPTFLGSLFVSIPVAVAAFLLTLRLVRAHRGRGEANPPGDAESTAAPR